MKHLPTSAGVLLGFTFVVFGSNYFLNFIPIPNDPPPADAPHKLFMGALLLFLLWAKRRASAGLLHR